MFRMYNSNKGCYYIACEGHLVQGTNDPNISEGRTSQEPRYFFALDNNANKFLGGF